MPGKTLMVQQDLHQQQPKTSIRLSGNVRYGFKPKIILVTLVILVLLLIHTSCRNLCDGLNGFNTDNVFCNMCSG